MLPRVVPLVRNVARLSQINTTAVRCMSGYAPSFKTGPEVAMEHRTTLNDLPVPQGSWRENYSKRNNKYNMFLGANIVFFFITVYATMKGGVWVTHSKPNYKKVEID